MLTILTHSTEDENNEPEIAVGGFHMCSLDAADEMRELTQVQ